MTQVEETIHWPYELDEVISLAIDRPTKNPAVMESLPFISKAKLLKDDWLDGKRFTNFEVETNASLTGIVAKALFGPRKPGWIQKGVFDHSSNILEVRVIPNHFSGSLQILVQSQFYRAERGSIQQLVCNTSCSLPGFGNLIEQQMGQFFIEAFKADYQFLGARSLKQIAS